MENYYATHNLTNLSFKPLMRSAKFQTRYVDLGTHKLYISILQGIVGLLAGKYLWLLEIGVILFLS